MADLHAHLKSLWTVWFFGLFVAIVVRTMLPSRRAEMEARGRIPFDADAGPAGPR